MCSQSSRAGERPHYQEKCCQLQVTYAYFMNMIGWWSISVCVCVLSISRYLVFQEKQLWQWPCYRFIISFEYGVWAETCHFQAWSQTSNLPHVVLLSHCCDISGKVYVAMSWVSESSFIRRAVQVSFPTGKICLGHYMKRELSRHTQTSTGLKH